jgi:hypothetical protein
MSRERIPEFVTDVIAVVQFVGGPDEQSFRIAVPARIGWVTCG